MRLGISIGDPNGIGPEVTLRAIHALADTHWELVPIGDVDLLTQEADRLQLPPPKQILSSPACYPDPDYGKVCKAAGAASAAWVEDGIAACLEGQFDGLITAPICKEAWQLAGIPFPGHTELLADRCNTSHFGMLLQGKGLRVMLATRHLPLREVAEQLCAQDIRTAVELLQEGLPLFGISTPRIAICGLNPHAGDGGTLGREEVEWIAPLIRQLAGEGFPVTGPHPADTVFHAAVQGEHDAIVALYHDQGLGPLKLWAFDEGVNITLGLPMVRTSPDHGTAFAIAGKGQARSDSMQEAIRSAARLAEHPHPWKTPSST